MGSSIASAFRRLLRASHQAFVEEQQATGHCSQAATPGTDTNYYKTTLASPKPLH